MFNQVEAPPNNVNPEVRQLCSQFGLHSYIGVLTGWQWAIEHKDQEMIYQCELVRPGSVQRIRSNDSKALNEVMRVNRR